MKINQIMNQTVVTIAPGTSLKEAAEKMRSKNIGALPVLDQTSNKIKGILTDRDIVVRAAAIGKDLNKTTAKEVMTEEIRTIYADEDISKAAIQMQQNKIRRLVVLDRENHLAGFLSFADLATKGKFKRISAKLIRSLFKPVTNLPTQATTPKL